MSAKNIPTIIARIGGVNNNMTPAVDLYLEKGDVYDFSKAPKGNAGLIGFRGEGQPKAMGKILIETEDAKTKQRNHVWIENGVLVDVGASLKNAHPWSRLVSRLIQGAELPKVGTAWEYEYLDKHGFTQRDCVKGIASIAVDENVTYAYDDAAKLDFYHGFVMAAHRLEHGTGVKMADAVNPLKLASSKAL